MSSDGPDHDRHFVVEVSVDGEVLGRGEGRSRREAETHAAESALVRIADQAATDETRSEAARP